MQGTQDVCPAFFVSAGLQQAAVDVPDQGNAVTIGFASLCRADAALGIQGMQGMGTAIHQQVCYRHDIAVRVLDGVITQLPVSAGLHWKDKG